MTSHDTASLLYLGLLGVAILGYFLAAQRHNLGQTLRQALLWGLIFVGTVAVAGLWGDLRDEVLPRQSLSAEGDRLSVPRGPDGHYHVTLDVNDRPIAFVVDTGATDLVLSRGDAERAGIDPDALAYLGRARTANGTVPMARVTLDRVGLGGRVDHDVPATVNGGDMRGSLLGMSYLQTFGRIEIADDTLVLTR